MANDPTNVEEYEPGAPSEGFLNNVQDDLPEADENQVRAEEQNDAVQEPLPDVAENESFENPYADEEEKPDPILENAIAQAEKEARPEEQLKRLGNPPVVPEEPSGLKSLLHTLFNWFHNEYTEREQKLQELKEYNEKKADLEYQVAMERRANDPKAKESAQWRADRNEEFARAVVDDRQLEQVVQAYAPHINQMLDQLYAETEKNTLESVNRARLISIEDTCIHTLLGEEFDRIPKAERPLDEEGNPMVRGDYITAMRAKRTPELVAEALLSGKRVSYLTTDPATGFVTSDEMKYLPKPNYQDIPGMSRIEFECVTRYASQREPVLLTETERHQRAVRNAELLKKVNYFDTMQKNSVFSDTLKQSFFKGWEEEHKCKAATIETKAVSTKTRAALSSLAVAKMMCDGRHSIEEILDPTKLLTEKDEIGREVLDRLQKNDYAWVAKINLAGRELMGSDLSRRTQKTNFNDTSSLYCESNRMAYQESLIIFDLSQDYNMNTAVKAEGKAWFESHGNTLEEKAAFKEDFDQKTMYYPTIFASVYGEKRNYALAATGIKGSYEWHAGIGGTFSRALVAERQQAAPDAPIHSLFHFGDVVVPSSTNMLEVTSKVAKREFFGKNSASAVREKADKMESSAYWKNYKISFLPGENLIPQMEKAAPENPVKNEPVKNLQAGK